MDAQTVKQIMKEELPKLVTSDKRIRKFVLDTYREVSLEKADKKETESRFDRILEEIKQDREEQFRKWKENQEEIRKLREDQNKKWEENLAEIRKLREDQNKKWEENQEEIGKLREDQNKKWETQNKKWEENQEGIRKLREDQNKRWEAQDRKWEDQNKKWEENQEGIRKLLKKVDKHETTLGALGSRWGIRAESSFRNALKWILEGNFDVKVLNINEYDDQGEVYGRPDQVELDIIISDGILIICEIKSSISKSDMYHFQKKAQFYEKRHNRTAKHLIAISPMVDENAQKLARELGIKVYSYADEISPDLLT
ncbi:MAG: DUF3782 domain-containing protein [Candidatus Aminicenantes bacterium]|nr:DUF3782 domain-containing protein [Candidatus Aminicenantes bacterium]NIM84588.1 DUF3782 domain-containing protein [Candidatus Aminicenantes bacterium]NIN24110.1 DUF3782 domain-containing protein [Candidatus Aminicenantes bacterium]NIN47816.1 DUF3782 domain-containing protein [Candidatus Aminicenantes bacterium]NIN90754.1 DUF3782 domain-containing protein [Candidatus Aminicenantes bacterium]